MLYTPTIRQLQYLLALEETQNFGKAAALCNVTQPTLSQAISEMEVLLGTKLLDRTRRKTLRFTSFGEEVLTTAQKIMPELDSMMERARQIQEPLSGEMRLGIIPTIAPYLLPDILPAIQSQFPKMNFQIMEEMSHILVQYLEEGKLDIALMALPYEIGNLKHLNLFEENFYCTAPKGTFKKNQKLKTQDLGAHNLLLLQDGHCLRDHVLSACHKTDMATEQPLKATSLQTLLQMTSQGYGITLIPEMATKHSLIPENIELHSFVKPAPARKIGLVWRSASYKATNINAVIKQLKKAL